MLAYFQFILLFTFIDFKPSTYGKYKYPFYADAIGWTISIVEIGFIPGVALYKICTTHRDMSIIQVRYINSTIESDIVIIHLHILNSY